MAVGFFVAADVAVGAFLATLFKYDDAWYPKTIINGVNVSGMGYEESIETISGQMKDYSITVKGRDDASLVIKGEDIELGLSNTNEIAKLYNADHEKFSINKLISEDNYEVELSISVNESKLAQIIGESQMVTGSDSYELREPMDAKVEYSETEKRLVIVPQTEGNIIDAGKLANYVKEAICSLEPQIDLTDSDKYADVYKEAQITSDSESVVNIYRKYNTYLYQWLTWDMGDNHLETITPDDIRQWLSITSAGDVALDKDKMKLWIEQFCLKYKTMGKTRNFTTHDGRTIEVSGGDYGWRIDYEKTVEDAYEQLTMDKDWGPVENYINNPSASNQANLTTTWEPEFTHTAFKMNFDNPTMDWDMKNYSEVDLTEQKVYVYKDGKLAHEAICVTGLPSDPERKTRTGCWYIKEKKESYVLKGADYSTPTKFWIRIMWTGTGYHYMNRRDWGSWDKDLYKRRGSHGCINLQYDDAKALFELIDFYDAVFIHE